GRSLHGRGVVSSGVVGRRWRAPPRVRPTVPTSRTMCRPTVRGCAQCGYATPPCPYREPSDHYPHALSSPALCVCPQRTDQTTSHSQVLQIWVIGLLNDSLFRAGINGFLERFTFSGENDFLNHFRELFTHRRILGRENTLSTQLLEILNIGQLAHSASLYGLVSMIVAPRPSSIPAACPSSHAQAFILARARR